MVLFLSAWLCNILLPAFLSQVLINKSHYSMLIIKYPLYSIAPKLDFDKQLQVNLFHITEQFDVIKIQSLLMTIPCRLKYIHLEKKKSCLKVLWRLKTEYRMRGWIDVFYSFIHLIFVLYICDFQFIVFVYCIKVFPNVN